jgi:hypothetical protein
MVNAVPKGGTGLGLNIYNETAVFYRVGDVLNYKGK